MARRDTEQVLRRNSTVTFGVLAIVATMAYYVWAIANPEIQQSTLEYAFGGAVGGALNLVIFRGAVWPAVILRPDRIVVRNVLVDYELTGGAPRLLPAGGGSVGMGDERQRVFPFAFSGSVIDQVRGMPGARRLERALAERPTASGSLVITRSRSRLLHQAPVFLAVGATIGAVAHLFLGR